MSFENGMKHFKEGNIKNALREFEDEIEQNDQNDKAWNALGICYSKTGDYESAGTCFENALILSPDNSTYQKNFERNEARKSETDDILTLEDNPKTQKSSISKTPNQDDQYRSPYIPAALSIFPGLGHVYNGLGGFAGLLRSIITSLLYPFVIGFFIHLYLIYDSYKIRQQMNNGEIEPKFGILMDYVLYFLLIPVLLALTVILAAVIAAFVFGMAGSAG